MCVFVSHCVCGNLSQQLKDTNTRGLRGNPLAKNLGSFKTCLKKILTFFLLRQASMSSSLSAAVKFVTYSYLQNAEEGKLH